MNRKMLAKIALIPIATTVIFGLSACGNGVNSKGEKDGTTVGRTVIGKLGYFYEGGYVLAYDGSGMQKGCELPAGSTYENQELIVAGFECP